MQFTGPVKQWRMWIDIESREPMDRDGSHEDFSIRDLASAATAVTNTLISDPRIVVKGVEFREDEEDE